jgi:hypothetical protein
MFVERNYKKGRKGGGGRGGGGKEEGEGKRKKRTGKEVGGVCGLLHFGTNSNPAATFPTPVPTLCHSLSLSLRHNHARPQVPTQVLI